MKLLPRTEHSLAELDVTYRVVDCDPSLADTAAFCAEYGFTLEQSANAIVVASKTDPVQYACCLVLATTRLDANKAVCKAMDVKRVSFASAEQTREVTGMEIGGVTAFGLPKDLPIYIDAAVMDIAEIVLGGGNRTSKLVLAAEELKKLPNAHIIEGLAKPKESIAT